MLGSKDDLFRRCFCCVVGWGSRFFRTSPIHFYFLSNSYKCFVCSASHLLSFTTTTHIHTTTGRIHVFHNFSSFFEVWDADSYRRHNIHSVFSLSIHTLLVNVERVPTSPWKVRILFLKYLCLAIVCVCVSFGKEREIFLYATNGDIGFLHSEIQCVCVGFCAGTASFLVARHHVAKDCPIYPEKWVFPYLSSDQKNAHTDTLIIVAN